MELDYMIDKLINEGGAIVCTASLSSLEIALARYEKRLYVNEDGIGLVWLPATYIKIQTHA